MRKLYALVVVVAFALCACTAGTYGKAHTMQKVDPKGGAFGARTFQPVQK